jgi:hypothetical protein
MDAMQKATEPKLRAYLPIATWAAIGLMVLAVLLSLSIIVFFPWHGTEQQQYAAASPSILVLLVVVGCSLLSTVLGGVGAVQARRVGARVSAISRTVSGLGLLLLVASALQVPYYVFIFAFIGG